MDIFREKPLRTWLAERQPLIPRPKIVDNAPTLRTVPLIPLPTEVTPEDAIDIIAGTSWARGIAEGTANKGGLTGDAKEDFIRNYAYQIAQGIFESSYLPRAPFRQPRTAKRGTTPPPAAPPAAPPGRPPEAKKERGRPPKAPQPEKVVVGQAGLTREDLERIAGGKTKAAQPGGEAPK